MGVVAGLVLVAAAVGLFFLYSQTEVERQLRRGQWVWVLVVGVDGGAHGAPQANFIAAAGVSPDGRAATITVPGELMVPHEDGLLPLAELWDSLGVEGIQGHVEGILEIPLDRWVVVDFDLFRDVVDTVGGVEVELEEQLAYDDLSQELHIRIPPGAQRLDGERALQFVRYKGYEDLPEDEQDVADRQLRTVEFIESLWREFRELSWGKWRDVAQHAADAASTDLSLWELVDVARAGRGVGPEQADLVTAPFRVLDGEVLPDFVRVRQLVEAIHRDAVYLTRDQVNVALFNGAGVRLLAHRTGVWLSERGFSITGTDNADRDDYEHSYLLSLPDAEEKAQMVAELLPQHLDVELMAAEEWGVERLEEMEELPEGTEVVMVLGEGFDIGG
ncbi:MAG: LCP family protein [Candidatus Bipolaricaulota bacterium]